MMKILYVRALMCAYELHNLEKKHNLLFIMKLHDTI